MIFDFKKFSNIVTSIYQDEEYSLSDALSVFKYYFVKFEDCKGYAHPAIKLDQIISIIRKMPYFCEEDMQTGCAYLVPESYFAMIDQHFQTKYRQCDYNINHFFSGKIRELRYYETCY